MTSYFDSSALLRILIPEPGGGLAALIWEETEPVGSTLVWTEARAGLARRVRENRLSAAGRRRALSLLSEAFEIASEVRLEPALARFAGELAERHALRAGDAIHLATALATVPEGTFVTFDRRLGRAASAAGLAVAPA
jgi:predicted nucleic acid-binding protein